jgi:hypothetical protein
MPSVTRDQHLFTAEQYRAKAVECAEKLKHTNLDSERREFRNSQCSFESLARNEQWLADNFDKTIHTPR